MTRSFKHTLATTACLLAFGTITALPALAQTPATANTRAQVKMDRDAFLAMVRWDETTSNWVLKDNMAPPAGVASREEVKAMRDKFLSMNKWNESTAQWSPVTGAPRDMSKLSRAEVEKEAVMFLKTHRFNESTSEWVLKNR
jgi:hypothetical protein